MQTKAFALAGALIASLAITMMPGTGRAKLKAVTMETAALLRRERLGAILTGRERQVAIDGERRVLIGDGGSTVAIPPDVAIDLLSASQAQAYRALVVRFHPDGASSGAVLRLSPRDPLLRATLSVRAFWRRSGS